MLTCTTHTPSPGFAALRAAGTPPADPANQQASARVAATLKRLSDELAPRRRVVRCGDVVHQAGEAFTHLHIVNAGFFKIVTASADGREQLTGLKFRGDWLGFDGIASGRYTCDAIAMDTGEVWSVRYDELLATCAKQPYLMTVLHEAMSRDITRDRDSLMSVCTLPADARVADFLHHWASALAQCGLRHDQITLRMTRAEIGNYLGMTLETVSRALSRMARDQVIAFCEKGRRELRIPDIDVLRDYVQSRLQATRAVLQ